MFWTRVVGPLLFSIAAAHAGSFLTVPPGLNPGDTYRLVFVSSETTDATSTDIGTYNSFVQDLADAVPALNTLGATWTAIVSTADVNAVDNISWQSATDSVYGLDGTLVSDPGGPLFYDSNDGHFDNAIPTDETGAPVTSGIVVWTGTSRVGTNTINGCCSAPLGSNDPFAGVTGSSNVYATWVSACCGANTNEHPVFAISSELTVPPADAPEPGTIALAAMGFLGIALRALKFTSRRS